MSEVHVNGRKYSIPAGASFNVTNNNVYINGKLVDSPNTEEKSISIIIDGNIGDLKIDRCETLTINGNTKNVDAGGSVRCDNIEGNVDVGGSLKCGDITGDVDAGGSVQCGNIGGDVDAGGSVIRK